MKDNLISEFIFNVISSQVKEKLSRFNNTMVLELTDLKLKLKRLKL